MTKFAIPALLALVGCNDNAPLGPDYVDPGLLGSWYYVSTEQRSPHPSPTTSYHGMRIDSDKTIEYLGIEVSTGKLALLSNTYRSSILRASDGVLIWQSYAIPGDLITESVTYAFDSNTLVLTGTGYTTTYLRAELGAVVATPVQATMEVTIDSDPRQVPTVAASIPHYVSEVGAAHIRFTGSFEGGLVFVDLESFTGAGRYSIGAGDGVLYLFYGDVYETLETHAQYPGTIDMHRYDESSGRCSGRFAFTVYHDPEFGGRVVSGTFDAPLYSR